VYGALNERKLGASPRILAACGLVLRHALKCSSEDDNIHILITQIELFIYEFFSFRFLTTEAMLPMLPCTARLLVTIFKRLRY
jgi:hypothetical protein